VALYLGIDGGGTKTIGVLADDREIPLRQAEVGPSNIHSVGLEGLERNLRELLERLSVRLADLDAVGVGLAGVGRPEERTCVCSVLQRIGLNPNRTLLTHDAHIALVGGVGDEVGAILIAGTGSIAYARLPSGEEHRCGGWGHLLGDEGGAYGLGLNALRAVARSVDGRDQPTALTEAILARVGVEQPENLIRWAHTAERSQIAELARVVFQCASRGDETARRLVGEGAMLLAELATTVLRKAEETPTLVLAGGLFEHFPMYRDRVAYRVFEVFPRIRIQTPERPPVFGAIRLARWMRESRP